MVDDRDLSMADDDNPDPEVREPEADPQAELTDYWDEVLGGNLAEVREALEAVQDLRELRLVEAAEQGRNRPRAGVFKAILARTDELAPSPQAPARETPPAWLDDDGELHLKKGWEVIDGPVTYPGQFVAVVLLNTARGHPHKVKLSLRTGKPLPLDQPYDHPTD